MVPNENARALCRDCHCLIIPVLRNKKVGMKIDGEFVRTDDTLLQTVCPLCESPKIDRLPDEGEFNLNALTELYETKPSHRR